MGFIDAHVHVWTPDTAHYPLARGYKKEDMQPPSFTPEELFKHSKPAGVDRIKAACFRAQISLNSTLENEHAECMPKKDAAGVWHGSGAGGRVEPTRRNARKR